MWGKGLVAQKMIQKNTLLKIIDNSGASLVQCIHVYHKGKNKASGTVSSVVRVSVKRLRRSIPKKKVKKSEVTQALVVSVRSPLQRSSGLCLRHGYNFAVLLNKELDNIASNRIVFPISHELRKTKFSKLLVIAPRII